MWCLLKGIVVKINEIRNSWSNGYDANQNHAETRTKFVFTPDFALKDYYGSDSVR